MIDKKEFHGIISGIDGKPRSEFEKLVGDFDFSRYVIKIGPENDMGKIPLTVRVPQIIAGFPAEMHETPVRRMALEDYLIRNLASFFAELSSFDEAGIAYQHLEIAVPEQTILPRTSMVVSEDYIEAHINMRLPSRNGLILGSEIEKIFFDEIQEAVNSSLIYCNLDLRELKSFIDIMEDAGRVRQLLSPQGLVSFVGGNAFLEREDPTDLPAEIQNDLEVEDDLKTTLDIPNAGEISGLGIKDGITLILGNERSGRIALMEAIAHGIYNHIPGDGREFVASTPDTVFIAAEEGRSVQKVDISAFIQSDDEDDDEFGGFSEFSTSSASGFESQAASVIEYLQVGARVMLFDEASSDPAFLSGDPRLNNLVNGGEMKTFSLAARARQMVEELGVSIIVAGCSNVSEFVPIADNILLMEDSKVRDVTSEVKDLDLESLEVPETDRGFNTIIDRKRWIVPSSIDASSGIDNSHIETYHKNLLEFGRYIIDLSAIRQIADEYQTQTVGQILYYLKLRYLNSLDSLSNVLDSIDEDLSTDGLRCLSPEFHADLARPRRYEIAEALNRLPSFRIAEIGEPQS